MSFRENMQFFHQFDIEEYLSILKKEYEARDHPMQAGSYLIDDPELPFYKPTQSDEHVFIMSFNYAPLPNLLLQALIDYPDLITPDTLVRWTSEQELIVESTIEELRMLG